MSKKDQQPELKKIRSALNSCIEASASSLGSSLQEQIKTHSLEVSELPFEELDNIAGDGQVFAVHQMYADSTKIGFLLYLPVNQAALLANQILGNTEKTLSFLGKSSLAELGNIMVGSFLNASALEGHSSVGGFAVDMLKTILQEPVSQIANASDKIIVAQTAFQTAKSNISINLLVLMDPASAKNFSDVR